MTNPFAGADGQPIGKVSVKLPVDDWLCRKMSSLNLTITEGYPTRNTDNTGLLRDQFTKPPRSSLSTGQSPKLWPERCRTYLRVCLLTWRTSLWPAGIVTLITYMRE